MKRALSVRPITSDWCSWVADWWQAAKRRRRCSSACQLKEQFLCVCVCVCVCVSVCVCVCVCVCVLMCMCCTDKRNWQLTAGGKGCVCACVCLCVCLMSDAVRYLNYANERSAENDWGISCWFCAVKVTHHAGLTHSHSHSLTHTHTHTHTHTRTHTPCQRHTSVHSHRVSYIHSIHTSTNKHSGTITVYLEFRLLSGWAPLKINFLSVLSNLCPSHRPLSKSTVQLVKSSLTCGPLVLNTLARHL